MMAANTLLIIMNHFQEKEVRGAICSSRYDKLDTFPALSFLLVMINVSWRESEALPLLEIKDSSAFFTLVGPRNEQGICHDIIPLRVAMMFVWILSGDEEWIPLMKKKISLVNSAVS